jgi:molybdopterin adenylyltransferase
VLRAAVITISDRGAAGQREDLSGKAVFAMLREYGYVTGCYKILPDERKLIEKELSTLCDEGTVDLICTTGGTGFARRDVTPEATLAVAHRLVPGICEAMRMAGIKKNPRAMLSRGVSVIRKNTLIINLPGSPKAACESLSFVAETLRHGIEILRGDAVECAQE